MNAALAGYAAIVTLLAVLMIALWWTTGNAADRRLWQAALLIQELRQRLDTYRHHADQRLDEYDTGEAP